MLLQNRSESVIVSVLENMDDDESANLVCQSRIAENAHGRRVEQNEYWNLPGLLCKQSMLG
jgi:hypothetical protein